MVTDVIYCAGVRCFIHANDGHQAGGHRVVPEKKNELRLGVFIVSPKTMMNN